MAARCRSRACCRARSAMARRSARRRARQAACPVWLKLVGQVSDKRGPGVGRRNGGIRQARSRQDRRDVVGRQRGRCGKAIADVEPFPAGVLAIAISAKDRKDDVKLGARAQQAARRGSVAGRASTIPRPTRSWCGVRARCTCASSPPSGSPTTTASRSIGARRASEYRETIRKPVSAQRGRYKAQPVCRPVRRRGARHQAAARGSGFAFDEKIVGGAVPRNYIPSVKEGVVDALKHGPLGFPVVDVAVSLVDGSNHAVDSSDNGVPHRRPCRHQRGAAAGCNPVLPSRSTPSRSSARTRQPPRSTPSCPAGAARS